MRHNKISLRELHNAHCFSCRETFWFIHYQLVDITLSMFNLLATQHFQAEGEIRRQEFKKRATPQCHSGVHNVSLQRIDQDVERLRVFCEAIALLRTHVRISSISYS